MFAWLLSLSSVGIKPLYSSISTRVCIQLPGQPHLPGMLIIEQSFLCFLFLRQSFCSNTIFVFLHSQSSPLPHFASLFHFPGCSSTSSITLWYFHCLCQVVLFPCPGSVTFGPLTCSHLTNLLYPNV